MTWPSVLPLTLLVLCRKKEHEAAGAAHPLGHSVSSFSFHFKCIVLKLKHFTLNQVRVLGICLK